MGTGRLGKRVILGAAVRVTGVVSCRYALAIYREHAFHFVYEGGVLRLEERLDLPEGFRGIANIREAGSSVDIAARKRALEAIRRIGESGVFNSGGKKLTRDEMHECG